jgi:hypothetical protein
VLAAILILGGAPGISWPTAFWIQSRLSQRTLDDSTLQAGLSEDRKWAISVLKQSSTFRILIPLTVRNVPSGAVCRPAGLTAAFTASDGTTWRTDEDPRSNVVSEGHLTSLRIKLDQQLYERVRNLPISIRARIYWTIFDNDRSTRVMFRNQFENVPGAGRCAASQGPTGENYFLLCDSAFREPKDLVWVEWVRQANGMDHESYLVASPSGSPFAAQIGINPIYQYSTYRSLLGSASVAEVHAMESVAYLKRDFEIANLRFADFELH